MSLRIPEPDSLQQEIDMAHSDPASWQEPYDYCGETQERRQIVRWQGQYRPRREKENKPKRGRGRRSL